MLRLLSVCLMLVMLFTTSCRSTEPSSEEIKALEARLKQGPGEKQKQSGKRWESIVEFYESRNYRPVWIANGKRLKSAEDLAAVIAQAPDHGLQGRYDLAPVQDPIEDELKLTRAAMKFGHDLASQDADVSAILRRAIDEARLPAVIDDLAPKHAEYRNLQAALAVAKRDTASDPALLRKLELNMERLRQLPSDLGSRYIRVNIPEYKLAVIENGSEILTMRVVVGKEETQTPAFSSDMTHLVFSPYWNIPESILTKETLPKIMEDVDYIRQQNIEVVRTSGGKAEVIDPSTVDWSEITPASDIRFRQKPGAQNSLGLVKFMFPNRHNVYLHDTPADSLFDRVERDFSHGCVRLERPLDLAAYLLKDQPEWTQEKIQAAMHAGTEKTVKLTAPLPVHILYITAHVAQDGTVNLFKDIYNKDGT